MRAAFPQDQERSMSCFEIDGVTYTSVDQVMSLVADLHATVGGNRVAFRDAKLRLGWILLRVRERLERGAWRSFVSRAKLNLRTAQHAMKLASTLCDESGVLCPHKVERAAKGLPSDLSLITLRQLEECVGLRLPESIESAPRCASETAAMLRRLADVFETLPPEMNCDQQIRRLVKSVHIVSASFLPRSELVSEN
jgi:hypothetical protein